MDDLETKLDIMKREIDALQIVVMAGKAPWYKSPSMIISFIALLFSFGTTAVSYHRAAQDDVRSARAELRELLQRLTALPRDNFDLMKKYQGDVEGQALTGFLNQENSLLARQASEIVDRFPHDISASEYLSVAVALMAASDVGKVPVYLDRAISQTSDPNVKVTALRNYGYHLLNVGKATEGRGRYEQALSIWVNYPAVNNYFKTSTDVLTEMYWAQAEFSVNNVEAAKEHVRKSLQRVGSLPPGPMTTQLQQQIFFTQKMVEQGAPADPLAAPRPPGG